MDLIKFHQFVLCSFMIFVPCLASADTDSLTITWEAVTTNLAKETITTDTYTVFRGVSLDSLQIVGTVPDLEYTFDDVDRFENAYYGVQANPNGAIAAIGPIRPASEIRSPPHVSYEFNIEMVIKITASGSSEGM